MSMLGSIIIYATGRGNIAYIDALFFASGANTQAGLNTIDVNLLNTTQQIVIMFMSMMSNPIAINSFVVFLRLYWFEKRFQHIVREARQRRGTISKSKSKAKPGEPSRMESGVNGRNITVMHGGAKSRITNDGMLLDPTAPGTDGLVGESPENDSRRVPEIKFADKVKRSDGLADGMTNLPPYHTRTDEDHIAILQRQRNGDDEILRIPGPRDAERGMLPERIKEGDTDEDEIDPLDPLSNVRTGDSANGGPARPPTTGAAGRQQTIKIEEPVRSDKSTPAGSDTVDNFVDGAKAAARTLDIFRLRKPRVMDPSDHKYHHDQNNLHVTPSQARRRQTLEKIRGAFNRSHTEEGTPYLSWEPTLGRNSQFPDLTEEQREELGGIEYRSLKTLALILVCYFWGFWILGLICLVPWIIRDNFYGAIVDSAGQSRTWWGFFTSNSAFMDLGFTLTPDSMNSFNTAVFPLILMSFFIVIGNTGFPVMLRFIIWILSLIVPHETGIWEELRFLLDHPRRCFTLLFPSGATWWLVLLLLILNGIDLVFFIILDLGSGPVSELPVGYRILDGLFQAASTRTAGFSCVNLALLHPGVLTSYLIMMYISVFPIAISVRRTNVYEEKSLGVYQHTDTEDAGDGNDISYVGAHLRRQLSFDLWFIFIGFFILSISEGSRLMRNDFTMFAVLFEIVSAYGTVGMSLGYTNVNTSLSGQFSVVGKLVIIGMQIRGRHRGLPYGLDRAILLPSESLNEKEAEDADARQQRRNSMMSAVTTARDPSVLRTRSRSMDRVNSNLIASVLHPGPAVRLNEPSFPRMRSRTKSMAEGTPEAESPRFSRFSAPPRGRTESTATAFSSPFRSSVEGGR